jgi:hypothetical protein
MGGRELSKSILVLTLPVPPFCSPPLEARIKSWQSLDVAYAVKQKYKSDLSSQFKSVGHALA